MYLLFSLLFISVLSVPDGNTNSSNDHLLIEHSVTLESAENAIQHIAPDLMIGVGCRECTLREIEYCLSNDVIEDHCCCQRKYHEVFPYIAHTCYVRSRNCEPTVRDCGVFDRLLNCCCHHYLGTKNISEKNNLKITLLKRGQVDIALLYSRLQVGHCSRMDGIKFEFNDISLYTKNDSE